MFNLPPYPPKDYVLKDVPKVQRDSPQFAPESLPRVTQTTLGLFCSPIEYKEGEVPGKIEVKRVNPYIMNKWTNQARQFWVDKPGKDDFFLHDIYNKYSVKVDTYNPREKHMEKVFNRSYKYELVCLEETRLQKLRNKCEKEQGDLQAYLKNLETKEHAEKNPPMKVRTCKQEPPFWWKNKETNGQNIGNNREKIETGIDRGDNKAEMSSYQQFSSGRWAEEPNLTAVVVDDPCRRKYDMQIVGQPFKSEACNYYYQNYPPPDIKFRPKRFA